MAKPYTLVTGRVLGLRAEPGGRTPHFHIHVVAAGTEFRVAVNTRSGTSESRHADLLYFADNQFRNEITQRLADVGDSCQLVPNEPGGLALDYQRGGMFDRRDMRRIPSSRPGPSNDLIEELTLRVEQAMTNPAVRIHAYGTRWGPEYRQPDQLFTFQPGNGLHDVHMNQGNWDEHRPDNGPWRDGGLLFENREDDHWCAIFLAFQTQSWRTDDAGDPVAEFVPWRSFSQRRRSQPPQMQRAPQQKQGATAEEQSARNVTWPMDAEPHARPGDQHDQHQRGRPRQTARPQTGKHEGD